MYKFCSHTFNPIKGRCSHNCKYCFVKSMAKRFNKPQEKIHLDEKELKTGLGEGNFIFVGSSCDMFADDVKREWIIKVLDYCRKFDNTYLFQTKNPKRYFDFSPDFYPNNSLFGTTIESNRQEELDKISKAPPVKERVEAMNKLQEKRIFLTIEPIIDFDLDEMVNLIKSVQPKFVNIRADSKGHNLPEPSWDKVQELVDSLALFTKVKIKDNLNRLQK